MHATDNFEHSLFVIRIYQFVGIFLLDMPSLHQKGSLVCESNQYSLRTSCIFDCNTHLIV